MQQDEVKHEQFEYDRTRPFHIFLAMSDMDETALMNHWHEDLEVAYGVEGRSRHYINGECVIGSPGRLIVTNSNFIHSILPDESLNKKHTLVKIIIVISPQFIEENLPEYHDFYFTNECECASERVDQIMIELLQYADGVALEPYENVRARALIMELLYEMCVQGTVPRESVDKINILKDIKRMKGVVAFIEEHYKERISQSLVARKFHFSTSYFSKYFKKCTGMTYTDYLTNYRLFQARLLLLQTNKSVTKIAEESGFTDDRRLILAFRKMYGETPLQYRKKRQK